jgi:tetratricopeptide (TPR) repeat protein
MSARIARMKRLGIVLLFTLAAVLAACATNAAPSIPPGTPPPEAYARFQKILAECWGVAQMKDIDANNPLHIPAFDCARDPLLKLAQDYQNFPETHRVLGWGYYYKNRDEAAARAEYQRALDIYHAQARTAEEADMYRRLGLLYMTPTDQTAGCKLLLRSQALDPTLTVTLQALQAYSCLQTATPANLLTVPAPLPNPAAGSTVPALIPTPNAVPQPPTSAATRKP